MEEMDARIHRETQKVGFSIGADAWFRLMLIVAAYAERKHNRLGHPIDQRPRNKAPKKQSPGRLYSRRCRRHRQLQESEGARATAKLIEQFLGRFLPQETWPTKRGARKTSRIAMTRRGAASKNGQSLLWKS